MSPQLPPSPRLTGHRAFELHVESESGTEGLALRVVETNGSAANDRKVGYLPADRYPKASDLVTTAVKDAGKPVTVLSPSRTKPIPLTEDSGVRLTLAFNVIRGVSKPGRARALLDGVARLSVEECLYWYAACCSGRESDSRRLRALRLYLADD